MSDTRSRRRPALPALPDLSIRWRLTLWYLVILSLVLLAFGALVYGSQASSISAAQDDVLRGQAQDLISTIESPSGPFIPKGFPDTTPSPVPVDKGGADPASLFALKQAAASSTPVVAEAAKQPLSQQSDSILPQLPPLPSLAKDQVAVLVDLSGHVVGRSGAIDDTGVQTVVAAVPPVGPLRTSDSYFTRTLPVAPGSSAASQPYRFYSTPILVKDLIFGTLVIGQPDHAPAQLRRLLLTLLLAAPLTLLVAAAGGYWLAARAMRPVRLVTATVQEISATDLHRRLHLPGRDEVSTLAATFDRMLDRLEAAFQQQRQFTSDASHELRTPLTVVQLEVERALADPALPAHLTRALDAVRHENAYMSRLVNDLLVLARADAGRAVLQPEVLDLSDLALAAVERLAAVARERRVVLAVGELPELAVVGDRVYLTQLLVNVIENGIKYTAGYGRSVLVEAGRDAASDGEQAWVRVRDTGPGIAPEHLPHLFERFYRVDAARSGDDEPGGQPGSGPGGSGLGLSIAGWVARAHGGEIRVQSEIGSGSTFEIRLPLDGRPAAVPVPDEPPERAAR